MAETVGAALVRNGKILLGLRAAHKSFAGAWDLFGGHLENGETPWVALCRELMEELGIDVTAGRFLETVTISGAHRLFVMDVYLVSLWSGEPAVSNDEHSAIRWFDLDEAARESNLVTSQYRAIFASLRKRAK